MTEVNRSRHAAMPPRVMIVISGLGFGGAERQVVELVNHFDPRTMDLQVCSLSAHVPLAAQLREPARLHILPKRWRYDLTVVPRLAWLLRAQRIDVVHGFLFDAEVAAALAGRLAGVRAVVGSERNTNYAISRVQHLAYRLTRSSFDCIVANSTAGAEFNRRLLGFPAEKYRIVRNGVDTERFHPIDRQVARAALGIGPEVPLIGMFASFKEQKNHPLLLHAAQYVVQNHPRAQFLLVGDAIADSRQAGFQYAQSVRNLVTELHLEQHCRLLGNCTDLPELYSACDLTVLPSLFEGTPNAVLESMACACPVVVTDVSDNAVVAPDGRVGRVVPSGDHQALAAAISGLLGNSQLRQQLGAQARHWAESEFSMRALCEHMAAVYRELAP